MYTWGALIVLSDTPIYICICICVWVHMFVYIYKIIYIHTHIHIMKLGRSCVLMGMWRAGRGKWSVDVIKIDYINV